MNVSHDQDPRAVAALKLANEIIKAAGDAMQGEEIILRVAFVLAIQRIASEIDADFGKKVALSIIRDRARHR